MHWQRLFLSPEILVGLVDPIGARRIEYIEIDGVFERLGLVRHVRGNAEHFAGMDDDFFAVDPELERTVQDVGELFVVVAVLGDDASFFQEHARQHDFLSDDELALQERLEVFERNGVPGDVLQRGRRLGGAVGTGSRGFRFGARFGF
jgi:hypothetical protein